VATSVSLLLLNDKRKEKKKIESKKVGCLLDLKAKLVINCAYVYDTTPKYSLKL
jgi:hypothetical protein